ncbi:helix-turn-helix transcriptional regulator [Actinokineospora sp. UTMC 2448]|uniref:helix-turn-helix domain-containing protein n=1 Tax=Actinokineospora sp. UTMC 2448 TaxID=2268449 RepID=UPI00216449E5|nr:helix-turn-helix transcriptional regulator [Actinokineospora sp. UTMC 2448]
MTDRHKLGTPRDRALGAELRSIREQAGMSLTRVCSQLHWNVSTLSRLERGMRHVSPEAVMGLAVIYGLPPDRRKQLLRWAKTSPSSGWWDSGPMGMPGELGAMTSYEEDSKRMTKWAPGLLPGLLQTSEYAAAVMRDYGHGEEKVQALVDARLHRQALLDRRGVDYTAIIGINALRNMLSSRKDFVEQLWHVRCLSKRDGISIRLVERPTMHAMSAWYLLDFDRFGSMVHLEHLRSATFLFDEEAKPYQEVKRRLLEIALPPAETTTRLEVITKMCEDGSWP